MVQVTYTPIRKKLDNTLPDYSFCFLSFLLSRTIHFVFSPSIPGVFILFPLHIFHYQAIHSVPPTYWLFLRFPPNAHHHRYYSSRFPPHIFQRCPIHSVLTVIYFHSLILGTLTWTPGKLLLPGDMNYSNILEVWWGLQSLSIRLWSGRKWHVLSDLGRPWASEALREAATSSFPFRPVLSSQTPCVSSILSPPH